MISVTTARELIFLNKSEIKGYGATYPVRGRILESANAFHVHIQQRVRCELDAEVGSWMGTPVVGHRDQLVEAIRRH
jgi:hypothetical protein